jgi:hypothetical protein
VKDFACPAFSRRIAADALRVALVVGILLNGINQGGRLLARLRANDRDM